MRSQGRTTGRVDRRPDFGSVVGRGRELAHLLAAFTDASNGRAHCVMLCGDAGIGKTAILRLFADSLPEGTAHRGRADEAERDVPFALLEHVFGLDVLWGGRRPERADEPSSIGARLVSILGELDRSGVVVLALDDVHWSDAPSLRALSFAFRRLRTERVLAVAASRSTPSPASLPALSRLGEDGLLTVMPVNGIDVEAAQQLALLRGRKDLPERYVQRLVQHTGGNPLHLHSILDELPQQAPGAFSNLPAPRSLQEIVSARLASCTERGGRLASAVAVLGGEARLADAGWVGQVAEPIAGLDEAIDAGLLERCSEPPHIRIRTPHPLYAAAIYQQLATAMVLTMHERAASSLEEEDAVLRHLVAARSSPDDGLAQRAIAHGRDRASAGAWSAAALALTQASQVAKDRELAEGALLEAAEYHLVVGADNEAQALLAGAPSRPHAMGRLLCLRAWLLIQAGDYAAAPPVLERAAAAAVDQDPLLRGRIANLRAIVETLAGNGTAAITWFTEALGLLPQSASADARGGLAVALTLTGRADEAQELPPQRANRSTNARHGGRDHRSRPDPPLD